MMNSTQGWKKNGQEDNIFVNHVFISTHRDYCHALFTWLNQPCFAQLQVVENSAARLLTRTHRSKHMYPILVSVHKLLVCFCMNFKVWGIMYKALNGVASNYISELLHPYTPVRSLIMICRLFQSSD